MDYIIVNGELYHHGVKGMKWGHRKAKESSGGSSKKATKKPLTPEQKSARRKKIAIAAVALAGTAAVTTAGVMYGKNRTVVNAAVKAFGKTAVSKMSNAGNTARLLGDVAITKGKSIGKTIGTKAVSKGKTLGKTAIIKGKQAAKNYMSKTKAGVKEGLNEAPKMAAKKLVEAVIIGVTLNAGKRALDNAVGKAESERIFKANDKKKIGSFWKVQDDDD